MLVTFDISAGGTVTDTEALMVNYLRCVKAIATASAASTPSVSPITAPGAIVMATISGTTLTIQSVTSGTVAVGQTLGGSGITGTMTISSGSALSWVITNPNSVSISSSTSISCGTLGAGNCIVSVISNTEAGGWTASSSDTTPTTGYSAANASIPSYICDLYVQNTGKTTYPYQKATFATNPSYAFSNASSPTYAKVTAYHFASATSSATVSMPLTLNASNPQYHLNDTTTIAAHLVSPASCLAANNSATLFHTMACTENYIHIIHPYYILSMGYRETQAWEANYNDNPPIYGFGISTITDTYLYPNASYAWMRSMSGSGGVNSNIAFGANHSTAVAGAYTNAVTGYSMTTGTGAVNYYDTGSARTGGSASPGTRNGLVPLMHLSGIGDGIYPIIIGPNVDANGAWVPPAIPINISIQLYNPSIYMNTGGKVKGLYKSLSNHKGSYTMTNYYTAGATYTVDGDSYYPVLGGRGYDLFLVRKA